MDLSPIATSALASNPFDRRDPGRRRALESHVTTPKDDPRLKDMMDPNTSDVIGAGGAKAAGFKDSEGNTLAIIESVLVA